MRCRSEPSARPRSAALRRCRTPSHPLSEPRRLALELRTYVERGRSLTGMESKGTELERALAFMARVDEDAATEVCEWSLGTALVTPELPRVWDASYFRAERADAGAQAGAEAVDLAREAGLAHCAVVVTDEDIADQLRPGSERRVRGGSLRADGTARRPAPAGRRRRRAPRSPTWRRAGGRSPSSSFPATRLSPISSASSTVASRRPSAGAGSRSARATRLSPVPGCSGGMASGRWRTSRRQPRIVAGDSPGRSSAAPPGLARDRQRADLRHRGRRRDDAGAVPEDRLRADRLQAPVREALTSDGATRLRGASAPRRASAASSATGSRSGGSARG